MLIFLDFDGVLHPYPKRKQPYFCQMPIFYDFFTQSTYLDCQFVITSLWRQHYTLAQLKSVFPQDFQYRIIGTTPVFSHQHRSQEIACWRKDFAREHEAWLAIDDCASLFVPEDLNQVFLCCATTGLCVHDLPNLAQHIAQI